MKNDYDIQIARKIRNMRIKRGLTLHEIGDKIGVTYQQFQKYEAGINRISGGRLLSIAKAFECPTSDLFDGIEEEQDTPSEKERILRRLFGLAYNLNQKNLAHLITVAEFLFETS